MRTSQALLLAGAVAAVSARQDGPAPTPAARLEDRQLDELIGSLLPGVASEAGDVINSIASDLSINLNSGVVAGCLTAASSFVPLLSAVPTPGPELSSYIENERAFRTASDPCSVNISGSMASEYTSYASELESWQSEHIEELQTLWSACGPIAGSTDLPTGPELCGNIAARVTAAANGGDSDGDSNNDDDDDSSAARLSGVFAVVAVVAGAVGFSLL